MLCKMCPGHKSLTDTLALTRTRYKNSVNPTTYTYTSEGSLKFKIENGYYILALVRGFCH